MATRETATIGTLIRNTEPHQKLCSSAPPMIGPRAMDRPTTPVHTPMALGCSSRSKTCVSRARVATGMNAAATPITPR
jgi:hypothetical protein